MSTKLAGLSSSYYYFSCNSRSHGKIGNSPLRPTIKRPKMIDDRTRDLFKFTAQYGNSMVISKPGKFQVKATASPNSSSSSWKKWLLGILLAVILPGVCYKGRQLLYLKSKIDKAVERAEQVVEMAEEAEKMVEELENRLPDDAKLKKSLTSFDDVAKKAVNEAKKAQDVVHKVKDMEEELEKRLKKAAGDQPKK